MRSPSGGDGAAAKRHHTECQTVLRNRALRSPRGRQRSAQEQRHLLDPLRRVAPSKPPVKLVTNKAPPKSPMSPSPLQVSSPSTTSGLGAFAWRCDITTTAAT